MRIKINRLWTDAREAAFVPLVRTVRGHRFRPLEGFGPGALGNSQDGFTGDMTEDLQADDVVNRRV